MARSKPPAATPAPRNPIPKRVRQPPPPITAVHYLKEWRQARGVTIEQMQQQSGINKSHISRVENRQRQYRQDMVEAYARILHVPIGDLLTVSPTTPQEVFDWFEVLSGSTAPIAGGRRTNTNRTRGRNNTPRSTRRRRS